MILPVLLVLAAAGALYVAVKGGLSNVARGRKYKSGTTWCFWRFTDVDSEYILRLHVFKTPWNAVCLHWIRKPDAEPWLHDHPVTFLSVILRGKYAELRQELTELAPRFRVHRWFNFIRASNFDRHRIVFVRKNTLTLCFMGPKTREWGFHMPEGHIGWKDYYARLKAGENMRLRYPLERALGSFYTSERVAQMSGGYDPTFKFLDEDVRRISTVAGDFDDEAETEPRK